MAMAIFKPAEVNDQQLDWIILRDGGVQLYWRDEILSDDLRWLKSNGYKIIFFDAAEWRSGSEWESQRRMHESLKDKLSFPDYYGENLDALDECIVDDLVVPDNGGLALVLNHYDPIAEMVLNIFARAVRHHLLFGRRLLLLVQSDDPTIQFESLGGIAAGWNSRMAEQEPRFVDRLTEFWSA